MVFLRSGVFGGLLSGAIWGTIWQTLLCIALIVGTGLSIRLEVAPGLIAGSVIGLFNVAHKPNNKKIYVIVGLLITTFLLVLCSFGRPFGSEFPISQWSTMICVLTLSSLIFFSVYLCVLAKMLKKLTFLGPSPPGDIFESPLCDTRVNY